MSTVVRKPWVRHAFGGLLVLVVLAPLFAWAAGAVGYAEPLENAAAATGALDAAVAIHPGLFPDYSVPGLGAHTGTFVSSLLGTALTFAIVVAVGRGLEQ